MSGRGGGTGPKDWGFGLRERCAQLEAMGGDRTLTAQARQQIRDGLLIEAEETLSTVELYRMAFLRLPR